MTDSEVYVKHAEQVGKLSNGVTPHTLRKISRGTWRVELFSVTETTGACTDVPDNRAGTTVIRAKCVIMSEYSLEYVYGERIYISRCLPAVN